MVNLLAQVCVPIASPTCVTTAPGQLSVTGTAPALAAGKALAQVTVTAARQVMTGACVSFTVTVKVQAGPAVLLTFTVVVPIGKNEPDAGVAVIVPHEPEVVGAG